LRKRVDVKQPGRGRATTDKAAQFRAAALALHGEAFTLSHDLRALVVPHLLAGHGPKAMRLEIPLDIMVYQGQPLLRVSFGP